MVNLDSLREFTGGNKEFEKELIELFISEVPVDITALEKAFAESDVFQIKNLAHKLKSSMAVLGLYSLNEYLSVIEKNAAIHEMKKISLDKFTTLKKILSENYSILKKKLSEDY